MRRALMVVLVVALGALIFAPAAFAQDDNPTGDDFGGDNRGGVGGFDDNPTGDDVMSHSTATATSTASAMPTASATPTATGTPTASATAAAATQYKTVTALPDTGGSVPTTELAIGVGALLVAGGLLARRLMG